MITSAYIKTFMTLALLLLFLSFLYVTDEREKWRNIIPSGYRLTASRTSNSQTLSSTAATNYDRNMSLIFVGGIPRSGTTLMRAILDAHPAVRCGQESLDPLYSQRHQRLNEAGVTKSVLDSAMAAFILEIIAKHGKPAPYLCNKDPTASYHATYLADLFPNAKFVLMIRDGRAVVNSLYKRNFGISNFNKSNPGQCLKQWSMTIAKLYRQCLDIGPERCFPMFYEKLILDPKQQTKALFKFLDIPWNSKVLHHHKLIGKEVAVTWKEPSTSQIARPINQEAIDSWVGRFDDEIWNSLDRLAPMLSVFGYDTRERKPNYTQFLENTVDFATAFSKRTNNTHTRSPDDAQVFQLKI